MTWLISLLESAGLNWLWGKISELVSNYFAARRAASETEDKNKADREKNEKAVTPGERDEAASDIIDHF